MSDNDLPASYGTAWFDGNSLDAAGMDGVGWPDSDPPTTASAPWVDGSSASAFGRSPHSTYAADALRPGARTGLTGQPVQPRYPGGQDD
jgi:hypothetical protein